MLWSMARKLRVEYPGAIYHVMNRGDHQEPIFHDDEDRQLFLDTLGEACGKTGWQIPALCLLSNHFHVVLETPQGNLVAGMKWFHVRKLRRGWCLGSDSFRKELLEQMGNRLGAEHYGMARHETLESRAEAIVAAEMKRRGWAEAELGRRAKGDAGKLAMAVRRRGETEVAVSWIAERLQMGTPGYLNHLLYRHRHPEKTKYAHIKNWPV